MKDFWIGLNDKATEGTYVWNDHTEVSFTKYAPNEPEGQPAEVDCFCQENTGLWSDVECDQKSAYVCKFPTFNSGGGRYTFFTESKDWHDANEQCVELGQTLVTIESAAENAYLYAEAIKR